MRAWLWSNSDAMKAALAGDGDGGPAAEETVDDEAVMAAMIAAPADGMASEDILAVIHKVSCTTEGAGIDMMTTQQSHACFVFPGAGATHVLDWLPRDCAPGLCVLH